MKILVDEAPKDCLECIFSKRHADPWDTIRSYYCSLTDSTLEITLLNWIITPPVDCPLSELGGLL